MRHRQGYRVGVVGATGAVGQMTLMLLASRRFPVQELRLFASPRSKGKLVRFRGRGARVTTLSREGLQGLDLVFFAVNTAMSREWCPVAVAGGAVAIDDSAAWRLDHSVPLVIPEVNGHTLRRHRGIVAIPNCSIAPVSMMLKPLHEAATVRRVVMSTYQSVSGYGASAAEELAAQVRDHVGGRPMRARVFRHPIAFNVIPQVDDFDGDGYTKEEKKFEPELRKLLEAPSIKVTGTAVRVPVEIGHSAAVNVELSHTLSVGRVRQLLKRTPGVEVIDNPARERYPTPLQAAGRNPCYVGRIRVDTTAPHALNVWVVMDNLRKGAALNSVHIAEALIGL